MGLEVVTSEFTKMSEVLKLVANNNAISIGGLNNFLSLGLIGTTEKKCLELAALDGRGKAEVLAKTLGAKLGQIIQIDQAPKRSAHQPMPVIRTMQMMGAKGGAEMESAPELNSSSLDYSLEVFLTFKLI
jgi:uncharacterized protein YggE